MTSAFLLLALLPLLSPAYASVIHVSASTGNDSNDGSAWQQAKKTVTAALTASVSGDEIWVASGKYVERISLKNGVRLYGGFNGSESLREQRDWHANRSILNGSYGGTVVTSQSGISSSTQIDGFNIESGTSDFGGGISCLGGGNPVIKNNTIHDNWGNSSGGGIYCKDSGPTISDNTINYNDAHYGGGIYCENSSPIIQNNLITVNKAYDVGGAIYCIASNPIIEANIISFNGASTYDYYGTITEAGGGIACVGSSRPVINKNIITENSAADYGGGIYCEESDPTISNNKMTHNGASYGGGISYISANPAIHNNIINANNAYEGGGIHGQNSSPLIANNTITANTAVQGGGLTCVQSSPEFTNNVVAYNSSGIYKKTSGGSPILRNNCVYGNRTDYSGLSAGTDDITLDPKLEDWQWGKVHIQPDSPCRDAGYNPSVGTGWLDMDGHARMQGTRVDIGADESDGTLWSAHVPGIVYVMENGNDDNDGSSWALAKRTVQSGITAAAEIGAQVWVKSGVYRETISLRAYVYLYGGFNGTETQLSDRNLTSSPTILRAATLNSTVTISSLRTATRVDGFTIRDGMSGISCTSSSPVIANNIIIANKDSGIDCTGANPTITNNTIVGNNSGYGISCHSANPTIANNIIAFNKNGIYNYLGRSTPILKNNCVFGNTLNNYSGLSAGAGDISVDPKLEDWQWGKVHLQPDSPCRDAGDDASVETSWRDIDGQSRIQGAHVDIGADESDGTLWSAFVPGIVYVSTNGNNTNDGSSWALAKKTIQAGIDAATANGAQVWVKTGVYNETISLRCYVELYGGFNGTETMLLQRNWNANPTVLEANRGNLVIISDTGMNIVRIDGFIIRNGSTGISCYDSSPTIANNIISGNIFCGIYCDSSSPIITNNSVIGNSSPTFGGGLSFKGLGNPFIINNIIAYNSAEDGGGGMYCRDSSPTITNNSIIANSSSSSGGGIHCGPASNLSITNNIIAFNTSGIYKNSSASNPTLKNNCVFGNSFYGYSGLSAGSGDITINPKLVAWQWGKLHVQPGSPCIDAGYDSAIGTEWPDIDGDARKQGAHIDIGADESDGTLWPDFVPDIVYVKTDGSDNNNGSSWVLAKRSVQAGIDTATQIGAQVWVKAGVYNERINLRPYVELYGGFGGIETALLQRSWTANRTILDGQQGGSVVSVDSTAMTAVRIDGFTIQNGTNAGGIVCKNSNATIINNTITSNNAQYGGGIYCYASHPQIMLNTISGNNAYSGGGIYCKSSNPMISNNIISTNIATSSGGGIRCTDSSNPAITNNFINANSASWGSGIYCLDKSSPTITNNTISSNNALRDGGGIYFVDSNSAISNNILAFNSSGIYKTSGSTPTLNNNCVFGNTAYNYSGLSAGAGDISLDPQFFNAAGGDFHLQPGSPCIDAGDNSVVQAGWVDMDGEARIFPSGGKVDIGADEFSASVIGSAGDAKTAADMASIAAQNAVVSASYNGFFYIQPDSHTSGIRVEKAGHGLSVGQLLNLLGTVKTNANAERYIDAASIAANGTVPIQPMRIQARSVGGDTLGNLPEGQAGVTDGKGLNTVGSLVTISGKITAIAPNRSWITIWDGVSWDFDPIIDQDGNPGVRCITAGFLPLSASVGDMATVKGAVSLTKPASDIYPLILCRTSADIVVH